MKIVSSEEISIMLKNLLKFGKKKFEYKLLNFL